MEQVGERCEETKIMVQEAKGYNRRGEASAQAQMLRKKLKEDHIFGKFENIVHLVDRRLRDVRVWSWGA